MRGVQRPTRDTNILSNSHLRQPNDKQPAEPERASRHRGGKTPHREEDPGNLPPTQGRPHNPEIRSILQQMGENLPHRVPDKQHQERTNIPPGLNPRRHHVHGRTREPHPHLRTRQRHHPRQTSLRTRRPRPRIHQDQRQKTSPPKKRRNTQRRRRHPSQHPLRPGSQNIHQNGDRQPPLPRMVPRKHRP